MPPCDLVNCTSDQPVRVCACSRKHHHGCATSAYGGYEGEGWDTCPSCYYLKEGVPELATVFKWREGPAAAPAAAAVPAAEPQAAAAAAPKGAKGGIASFFAPRAAAPPAVVDEDDVELVESERAVAAGAAGRALAALIKPPLDAAALARQADILKQGKRDAAKESKLAKPRSVGVNDGGKRDRRAASGQADGNAPAKKAKPTATRGASSGGKVCKVTPEKKASTEIDRTANRKGGLESTAHRDRKPKIRRPWPAGAMAKKLSQTTPIILSISPIRHFESLVLRSVPLRVPASSSCCYAHPQGECRGGRRASARLPLCFRLTEGWRHSHASAADGYRERNAAACAERVRGGRREPGVEHSRLPPLPSSSPPPPTRCRAVALSSSSAHSPARPPAPAPAPQTL